MQLPDPNAQTFTTTCLRQAMLDTIAALNKLAEEEGITEVTCVFDPACSAGLTRQFSPASSTFV